MWGRVKPVAGLNLREGKRWAGLNVGEGNTWGRVKCGGRVKHEGA